ncbi:LacI family DNA-binding transcriptional regulator [Dactylosporangium sucinum]|uniref:LacI family DNA-binding transcriptional regulator n=1 Tax=Dactylosporangium sucinum TaxID=1424081 RepID=UPI001E3C40F9|nr:LacI family DNA-binding transcriptional regulator [Dactylosporangium sucinum]
MRQDGPRLADVARRAGVSTGTASAVLNGRDSVAAATILRVQEAVADLGYVSGAVDGPTAAHWRGAASARGCSNRRRPADIRRRRHSRDGRCRCWPIRGRGCRSGAITRRAGPSAAGRRSRRG